MKNIIKTQTCQTEITTKLNNRQIPVVKLKKKRISNTEISKRTRKDNQLLYDRHSDSYKIRKIRKQTTSPYLSDRKLLSFLAPYSIPLDKKFETVKDIYIYNINSYTKRMSPYDQFIIKERLKKERLTVNVSKMFYKDDDSQPKYGSQSNENQTNSQKQEQRSKVSTVPAKNLPDLTMVVIGKAKKLWEEAKTKNKSQFYIRRELRRWYESYPQAQKNFNIWFSSAEAKDFKDWLN